MHSFALLHLEALGLYHFLFLKWHSNKEKWLCLSPPISQTPSILTKYDFFHSVNGLVMFHTHVNISITLPGEEIILFNRMYDWK